MKKLYTRSGDDGTTGLFGSGRVGKDHPRVEGYGTVDELNAWIGLCASACDKGRPLPARLLSILSEVQPRLFDVGADLATPTDSPHRGKVAPLTAEHVKQLENWIDETDAGNEPMRHFILPGGTELAARLHVARTVCRRAERQMVALGRTDPLNEQVLMYLNRLGDLLFAMARRANKDAEVPDVMWPGQ